MAYFLYCDGLSDVVLLYEDDVHFVSAFEISYILRLFPDFRPGIKFSVNVKIKTIKRYELY